MSPISGEGRFGAVVSATGRHGDERSDWLRSGCLELVSFTLGPMCASTPPTQGRSPVRESRTPGSVRGVLSNEHPLYVADRSANAHFAEQRGRTVSLLRPFGERARAVD